MALADLPLLPNRRLARPRKRRAEAPLPPPHPSTLMRSSSSTPRAWPPRDPPHLPPRLPRAHHPPLLLIPVKEPKSELSLLRVAKVDSSIRFVRFSARFLDSRLLLPCDERRARAPAPTPPPRPRPILRRPRSRRQGRAWGGGGGGRRPKRRTALQDEEGKRTDDDLPPSQQTALRRRSFSGNGRASVGAFPFMRPHDDLESQIHRVEQDAYTGVLRAFKVQSDAISWEKESLITELRKELRVSDDEHRELLNKVNEDGAIRRMRELRQGGGTPSGVHRGSRAPYDTEPGPLAKRPRASHLIPSQSAGLQSPVMPSHSAPSAKWGPLSAKGKMAKPPMPLALPPGDPSSLINHKVYMRWPEDNNFYEATITNYNPATGEHALVYDMGTQAETWESVRLSDIAPEDIRWDFEGHGSINQDGRAPPGPSLRRQPSNGAMVERVLSNPNMLGIEKARKLLKDQEQSLLDAIARLDEASDTESEDMATEGRMGSAGDHMGGNGIAC
ncbi:hypothetical protein EJB05_43543, partial [Eragrostis curvula]